MKRIFASSILTLLLVGCSDQSPNENEPNKIVTWPPRTGAHNQEAFRIPAGAELGGGVAKDDPLRQTGVEVLGSNGSMWPLEGKFSITGGTFSTKVGGV